MSAEVDSYAEVAEDGALRRYGHGTDGHLEQETHQQQVVGGPG